MFSGNLLKAGWNVVNEQDIKVIDSNSLLEKRIQEANAALHIQHSEDIPMDMVDGVDAFTVANLLGEEGVEEGELPAEMAQEPETDEMKPFSSIIKAAPVYSGPSPEEVAKEIDEKYKAAELEAARIISEAEEKAEGIRNAAHEQGKKTGYDEGYANGLAQMMEKEQELQEKERLLEEEYQKKIDELEPQFIDALTGIYEHIFHVELKNYREIIVHLISGAVRKIEGTRDFIVHVSKDDYPYVSMQKKQIQAAVTAPNSSVEIIEDLTLAKSECMIETGGGIFDCSLGTELKELTAKLKLLSYEKKGQNQ